MEQFTPAQLLRLIGQGGDEPLPAIPDHLSYQERLALRRARIAAIDEAQARQETAKQSPAVVTIAPVCRSDDMAPSSQAWLKAELENVYRLGPVWAVSEARAGHPQWMWRAAVAGMLTKSRNDIKSPPWAVSQIVRALVAGDVDDPRNDQQLATWDDWPKTLYSFARVRMPQRFRS